MKTDPPLLFRDGFARRTSSSLRVSAIQTRGGGFEFRATTAQWHAGRAVRRPKLAKLALNDALRQ